jgi:hypothetical protein
MSGYFDWICQDASGSGQRLYSWNYVNDKVTPSDREAGGWHVDPATAVKEAQAFREREGAKREGLSEAEISDSPTFRLDR